MAPRAYPPLTSSEEYYRWIFENSVPGLPGSPGTDRYGDVIVDTARSHALYKEWLARARPAPGPDGLRRPLWFARPVRPADSAYRLE
ncbi:MAG: hypothetical protein ACE5HV_07970 [Acidobacteriota bacterium]